MLQQCAVALRDVSDMYRQMQPIVFISFKFGSEAHKSAQEGQRVELAACLIFRVCGLPQHALCSTVGCQHRRHYSCEKQITSRLLLLTITSSSLSARPGCQGDENEDKAECSICSAQDLAANVVYRHFV